MSESLFNKVEGLRAFKSFKCEKDRLEKDTISAGPK